MKIAGIELEPTGEKPWHIKTLGWICFDYRISRERPIKRDELSALIGCEVDGKVIRGVESFAVEDQAGKLISLAFDDVS